MDCNPICQQCLCNHLSAEITSSLDAVQPCTRSSRTLPFSESEEMMVSSKDQGFLRTIFVAGSIELTCLIILIKPCRCSSPLIRRPRNTFNSSDIVIPVSGMAALTSAIVGKANDAEMSVLLLKGASKNTYLGFVAG